MTTHYSLKLLTVLLISLVAFWPATICAGQQKVASGSTPTDSSLAVVDGRPISESDVDATLGGKLFSIRNDEYKIRRQALDAAIDRMLLENEAARRSESVEQLVLTEIERKAHPVSDDEISAVYEGVKERNGDQSESDQKAQIATNLRQARLRARRHEFLAELRARARIQVNIEPPRADISAEDSRAAGSKSAPVVIVEFTDFQCPFCGRAAATIGKLEQRYKEKIRVVFRDFPLTVHPDAAKAAEAGSCANEQGKFWEMHDKLFQSQSDLKVASLERYAAELGLNTSQFNDCLGSGRYAQKWRQDIAEASAFGVRSTPSFFINGRLLVGAMPLESFAEVIDEELAANQSAVAAKRTPVAAK